jgi:hypothetical protein
MKKVKFGGLQENSTYVIRWIDIRVIVNSPAESAATIREGLVDGIATTLGRFEGWHKIEGKHVAVFSTTWYPDHAQDDIILIPEGCLISVFTLEYGRRAL